METLERLVHRIASLVDDRVETLDTLGDGTIGILLRKGFGGRGKQCNFLDAGFERKLQLVGVGYRAQMQGKSLNLALGYSHPISFEAPEGVSLETPSQTEIVVRGIDKQKVGQAAAEIRAFRPPEPYKGKGVKYLEERIQRKVGKAGAA